jgi:hypothetical protein
MIGLTVQAAYPWISGGEVGVASGSVVDNKFACRGVEVVLIPAFEERKDQTGVQHANEWRENRELSLHCAIGNLTGTQGILKWILLYNDSSRVCLPSYLCVLKPWQT